MSELNLRALQAPLKEQYRADPNSAKVTLKATGAAGAGVTCSVQNGQALLQAGLHPATGGNGLSLCSGNMLLEALVSCAGVTLGAVANSLGIALRSATITAEGDLDFRGTLAVSKDAPVGFTAIRVSFDVETDAGNEEVAKLLRLTERYCVVLQTLKTSPELTASRAS